MTPLMLPTPCGSAGILPGTLLRWQGGFGSEGNRHHPRQRPTKGDSSYCSHRSSTTPQLHSLPRRPSGWPRLRNSPTPTACSALASPSSGQSCTRQCAPDLARTFCRLWPFLQPTWAEKELVRKADGSILRRHRFRSSRPTHYKIYKRGPSPGRQDQEQNHLKVENYGYARKAGGHLATFLMIVCGAGT